MCQSQNTYTRLDAKCQNVVSMHMSGSVGADSQDSLSIRVPCLLPSCLSGWESLEVRYVFALIHQVVLLRNKCQSL